MTRIKLRVSDVLGVQLLALLLVAGCAASLALAASPLQDTSQIEGDTKMDNNERGQRTPQAPKPNPDLKSLDRLVGTWKLTGDARGESKYEWAEGGFFLVQHFDIDHAGHRSKGIEFIGHAQPFGDEPSPDIRARVYDFLDGFTLDYVYELEGDTLTIWGGEKGSPAYYKGKFSADGRTLTGGWVYPGGGYQTTATKKN